MLNKIYSYGKQHIDQVDIRAVLETLQGDWLTQGPKVREFEDALCEELHAKHASAVANGTAALHLAALALGWKKGDIILTTPITFLASANCAVFVGADIDFVDIDEVSYTISPTKLEEKIQALSKRGRRVTAVVAVDYAGHPCDWKGLRELADRYEFQLVADCCHALGARYEGDKGYAAKYADAVCLSFHPVKHITTGEGGAVLSNNESVDKSVKIFRTHGMIKDESIMEKNDGPWYYEMHAVGYNYRITDFQCALGITQLQKLSSFLIERRRIAAHYDALFTDNDKFIVPKVSNLVDHAYHLYPLCIRFDQIQKSKKEMFLELRSRGINCQVHYIPVHLQPYYKNTYGFKRGDYPIAERFYEKELSIPMYPDLSRQEVETIGTIIHDIVLK